MEGLEIENLNKPYLDRKIESFEPCEGRQGLKQERSKCVQSFRDGPDSDV